MTGLVALSQFGFDTPARLVLLLVAPLLVLLVLAVRRRRVRYQVAYTNVALLGTVIRETGTWRRSLPLVLLALAVAAIAAALARPHVSLGATARGTTIELVVDDSGSMEANDVPPSRLAASVAAMHAFVDALPKDARVGLMASSDQGESLAAPSLDHGQVSSALDVLTPHGGTALAQSIVQGVKVILSVLAAQGVTPTPNRTLPAAIVVATDGGEDRGTVGLEQAAAVASEVGIRIYGVTIGTKDGVISKGTGVIKGEFDVPADPGTMALLARETDGRAYTALTAASLNTIYRQLGTTALPHQPSIEITSWFEVAAAALLCLSIGALRLQAGALP